MFEKKGLFVGLNTIDLQFLLDKFPQSNTKQKALKSGMYVGGPASNAAVAFASLGGHANLLTPIGKHHFTDYIINELSGLNVTITDLIPDIESEPTFASILTTNSNGERTVFSYHPKNENILLEKFEKDLISSYDIVLFDGFCMDIALELAAFAKILGKTTVLDGGSWKKNTDLLLEHIDIVICSEQFHPPGCSTSNEVFDYLESKYINRIVITRGHQPILYKYNEITDEIPPIKVNAIDTLGAGDFFHGAFCYYFVCEESFNDALEKAAIIAAKSCEFFGTREWLNNYLNKTNPD